MERIYNAIMNVPVIRKICSLPVLRKLTTYEAVTYIFFGALTTLINWLTFMGLRHFFNESTLVPTTAAFVVAVMFAYVVNKKYVFKSRQENFEGLAREFGLFILARLLSFGFDLAFVYVTVDVLGGPDWLMKILSNVFVLIMNFIASKLFIFRHK